MSVRTWVRWFSGRYFTAELGEPEALQNNWAHPLEAESHATPGILRPGVALEEYPSLQTFEFIETEQSTERLDAVTKQCLGRGCSIKDLPHHDILPVMKESALVKLGTFYATDEKVLRAFEDKTMLTRGSQTLYDPQVEANWKKELQESFEWTRSVIANRWKDRVKLGAYALRIKGIADCDHGSVLEVILKKQSTGTASMKIWEFPSVMAVISYHWDHWAQALMYLYFALFLVWLSNYVIFMILYIGLKSNMSIVGSGKSAQQLFAHLTNIMSLIFMIPALLEIVLSLASQGASYLQIRNLLQIAPVNFQIVISFCHAFDLAHNALVFELLLISQCVLLFTKAQNFGSAIGRSSHISAAFLEVMFDVRYMLFYIIYSTFSAALCLGVLYKRDEKFQGDEELGNDFDSFRNALISTFGVTFGNFEVGYVLEAGNFWIKAAFFLVFQTYMTITVLNLLIAVMSNAYSKVEKKLGNKHERTRAEVIHSLEVIGVTKIFNIELPEYVHFLVAESIQKDNSIPGGTTADACLQADLRTHVHHLTTVVQNLSQELKTMAAEHETRLQRLTACIEGLTQNVAQSSTHPHSDE